MIATENACCVTALRRPRLRLEYGEIHDVQGWSTVAPLPAPKLIGAYPYPTPATQVQALAGERELLVRFECEVESTAVLRPTPPRVPVSQHEHVWFEIAPHNDPTDRWRIAGTFMTGALEVSRTRFINGEAAHESPDTWSRSTPTGAAAHETKTHFGITTDSWWMEFAVPWSTLGLSERPPVIGFCYGRGAVMNAPDPFQLFFNWPRPQYSSNCPRNLESGEALMGKSSVAPDGIELQPPRFGENRGRFLIGENWNDKPARLKVTSLAPDETLLSQQEYLFNNDKAIDFEYFLSRKHSSHLTPFETNTLSLEVLGAAGETLYRARLPFDRHLGICIDEPYGEASTQAHGETTGEKWLNRIVRALPRLERRTTVQGAESDFCLYYEDGTLAVNLMSDDAWQKLAGIIEARFETSADRMIAATALVAQKSVTNLVLDPMFFNLAGAHTYHSAHHELMGPLSILRFGGGSALCRAAVLARLLQQITVPSTGATFDTRVLSLTLNGGPVQAGRSYAGSSALAPFGQEPGRAGAVAVNYRGSQTLLDPTAPAFFPTDESTLATVEEIIRDGEIRSEGAGGLAEVYAQLDIEELRRQPVNRLLSKGVFPDLCPDEDGIARADVERERQVLRTLQLEQSLHGLVDTHGKSGQRNGDVRVTASENGLRISIQVSGVATDQFNERDKNFERVHVALDAAHNHEELLHFAINLTGQKEAWRENVTSIQRLFKNLSTEGYTEVCKLPNESWAASIQVNDGDGYTAHFEITWQVLGLRADSLPSVIGFNAWIDGRFPEYEQVFLAPPRWRSAADPFSFVDLYLKPTPVTIGEIDLGVPRWGWNNGEVLLQNHSTHDVEVALRTETHLSMRRHVHHGEATRTVVPANSTARTTILFFADPEEKMTAGQALKFVASIEEREIFRAAWRMTYCGSLNVYHRYGSTLIAADNPQPGTPDFLQRKIEFICSRLPEFERATTRDGAPSDFTIRASDGSMQFNLMEAGILDQIADYITQLYDSDFDRVLGMFYLKLHPAFMRHASAGHRFLNGAGGLSIIRGSFAGCSGNCGPNAHAFAAMASHLRINGKPVVAHSVPICGHVINAIEWKGKKVLLDADLGHIFLNANGSDFATIEDFRSGTPLLTTAGPGDLGRYFSFQDIGVVNGATPNQAHYAAVFPAGAVVE